MAVKMPIKDALENLMKALAIAHGGNDGTIAPQRLEYHTKIGDTFSRSIIRGGSVNQECITVTRRMGAKPSAAQPDVILGGDIIMRLEGDAQPEAARTLNSILKDAYKELGISSAHPPSRRVAGADGLGRMLTFSLPDDSALAFAEYINGVAEKVRSNPALPAQCFAGTSLSLGEVNKIPGAKPFVLLSSKGEDWHFNLRIEGVPMPLAARLAPQLGKKLTDFEPSGKVSSRDRADMYDNGGVTMEIPLNHPDSSQMMTEIARYTSEKTRAAKKTPGGPESRINRTGWGAGLGGGGGS